ADHTAALVAAARPRAAQAVLQQASLPPNVLTDPATAEAVSTLELLAALITNTGGGDGDLVAARFNGRLAGLLAETPPSEPEPVDELPDVTAIASQALEAGPRQATVAAVLLADRAWLDLYNGRATDEALLDAVAMLVPEQSPVVTRLRGWQAWRSDDVTSAQEKLEAVAEADPLSALGLLLIRREAGEDVLTDARQLLNDTPSGLAAATIADAFDSEGLAAGAGAAAGDVRAAIEEFPLRLLDLIDPANSRRFYSLAARPEKVSHQYGEPMLIRITLRNIGPDPITIGPAGLLSDEIRLDAGVRGLIQQRVPAAATSRWAGRTRLDRGERLQQTVRLDGPQLATLLASNPLVKLTMFGDVVTNPVTVMVPPQDDPDGEPRPAFAVAAGGQLVGFQQVVDRVGLPIDLANPAIVGQMQRRLAQLRDGNPEERVRAADATFAQLGWLGGHVQRLQTDGGSAEEIEAWRQLAGSMSDALRRAAVTSDETVAGPQGIASAWVRFRAAATTGPDDRVALIAPATRSPEPAARMVALLGLSVLAVDDPQSMLLIEAAGDDDDPTVRRFAMATLRLMQERPAEPE
ncbi:MAG: hypothetical protein AAF561_14335, partial [Planctomycetota bacterium]